MERLGICFISGPRLCSLTSSLPKSDWWSNYAANFATKSCSGISTNISLRGLKGQAFFQCFTVDVTFEMLILLKKNKNLICLLLCMVNYVIHFLFFYFLFVQHLNLEC